MEPTKLAWLRSLVPYANQAKDCWPGMRVSVCLAQAALESNWGKKPIGGFNLWGLKDLGWEPGHVDVPTHEWVNGKRVPSTEAFEDLPTPVEAFACYGRLMTNAKPYADARECADLESYVRAMAKRFCPGNPTYAQEILAIIEDYGLAGYDIEA